MSTNIVSGDFQKLFPQYSTNRPHVTVSYNPDALSNQSSDSEKPIALIGSATNGSPNVIHKMNSLLEAKQWYGSGDLVTASELAWNPENSSFQNGGSVYGLRVDTATQATLVQGALTFTSTAYGDVANNVYLTLDKNPISGAYRIEVSQPKESYDRLYDGLGQIFSVSYDDDSGNTTAAISIDTNSDGTASSLTVYESSNSSVPTVGNVSTTSTTATVTLSGSADGDTITIGSTEYVPVKVYDINSGAYPYVYNILEDLSLISGFTVTVIGNTSLASSALDAVASIELSSDGYTATANLADIENTLQYDTYVTVATDTSKAMPANFVNQGLSGGTDGSVPVSWADKFQAVTGSGAYYIVPLTGAQNVQAELKEFLYEQSMNGYHYRSFVGGGFDESADEAISREVALRSERMGLIANSGYYTNIEGVSVHIPGYLMAAYAAGVQSSLQIGGALTNKYISLDSLDQVFTEDELDRLNINGVIGIERVSWRGGDAQYRFVEDVTTYTSNSDDRLDETRISLGEIKDFLFDDLRHYLETTYIGVNISTATDDVIKEGVASFLDTQVTSGLIVTYDRNSIIVSVDGDDVYIVFTVDPSQTIDNMVVYGTYNRYSATTSNSSTSTTSTSSEGD